MNDREYLAAFESCALQPGEFHHSDHVRVAWMMLEDGPLEEALARFSQSLRRFAAHVGANDLYHQTITWTYLFAINERRQRLAPGHDWPTFEAANPDLFSDHRGFMGRYYSPELLESNLAKQSYVLPDRAAA